MKKKWWKDLPAFPRRNGDNDFLRGAVHEIFPFPTNFGQHYWLLASFTGCLAGLSVVLSHVDDCKSSEWMSDKNLPAPGRNMLKTRHMIAAGKGRNGIAECMTETSLTVRLSFSSAPRLFSLLSCAAFNTAIPLIGKLFTFISCK